jgi:ribulose-5-phosphate 4-epimerase/fuculose-1-phosphate aldolase
MEQLISKYNDKLVAQGLCDIGTPLIGGLDAEIVWNRKGEEIPVLTAVINNLPVNSLLFAEPAEPFRSIIRFLSQHSGVADGIIKPEDTETRTFLHDIPVIAEFNAPAIIQNLSKRKAVIIKNRGIVSFGIVSPEQAFIFFSSVCFSCFVKFFVDHYYKLFNHQSVSDEEKELIKTSSKMYSDFIAKINITPSFIGPFKDSETVIKAITEAGKITVDSRMVDSFFGNISYKLNNTIYISQTGSSLDELAGYIDPCPIDNSATVAITASSEFKAHKSIYELTDCSAILHGHPKFSVILSMICDKSDCKSRGKCHINCKEERFVAGIPIVPGEVGTGPSGLCNTLPPAMRNHKGVIVYGHGLFTRGNHDFTDAFETLMETEKECLELYRQLAVAVDSG